MKKAAPLLFLFYTFNTFSQVSILETENEIQFRTSSNTELLSFPKNNLLFASSFKEKVKSKFGSFEFKRTALKKYSPFVIDSIYHFDHSIFVTGILAEKFPVEIGVFFDNEYERKFWMSAKVEDSLGLLKTITLNFKAPDLSTLVQQIQFR